MVKAGKVICDRNRKDGAEQLLGGITQKILVFGNV
jgi:hypothetical protein